MSEFNHEEFLAKERQEWIDRGLDEIRERLRKRRCSDCDFWMKSSLCPKEHNVRGYSKGPSCDAFPCSKFKSCWQRRIVEEAEIIAKMLVS